jgi:hypothetical protein
MTVEEQLKELQERVKKLEGKPSENKKVKKEGPKRELSEYNKFMKTELTNLKKSDPDSNHKDRWAKAIENWKNKKM